MHHYLREQKLEIVSGILLLKKITALPMEPITSIITLGMLAIYSFLRQSHCLRSGQSLMIRLESVASVLSLGKERRLGQL